MVLDAMMPYLTERFGNAGSRAHRFGWEAEEAVETARGEVARAIHAMDREIVFTSGATESINLALRGVCEALQEEGRHVITSVTEHPATLATLGHLSQQGWHITYLPVDREGLVSAAQVEAAMSTQTVLVTLLHGNNEVGTLQPISEIGRLTRRQGIYFHVDAAQALGRVALDVQEMCIDLLSMSAHKVYGPKGVGALFVRRRDPRVRLSAQMHGGGQERGLRSGTLNVPGIVGFGRAAALASERLPLEAARLSDLRDRFVMMLQEALPAVHLLGHPKLRLPGHAMLCFDGIRADDLLLNLRGVAASTGSACASATQSPSHVLRALGLNDEQAAGCVRFGFGRFNHEDDISEAVNRIVPVVQSLRAVSPRWELQNPPPGLASRG